MEGWHGHDTKMYFLCILWPQPLKNCFFSATVPALFVIALIYSDLNLLCRPLLYNLLRFNFLKMTNIFGCLSFWAANFRCVWHFSGSVFPLSENQAYIMALISLVTLFPVVASLGMSSIKGIDLLLTSLYYCDIYSPHVTYLPARFPSPLVVSFKCHCKLFLEAVWHVLNIFICDSGVHVWKARTININFPFRSACTICMASMAIQWTRTWFATVWW